MSRFAKHFRMRPEDVLEYVKEKVVFFDRRALLRCEEISGGNINYVFRVWEEGGDRSLIVKHVGEPRRSRIEAEALRIQAENAPDMVPVVYLYDPGMACICMEDLRGYSSLRDLLCAHTPVPQLADQLSNFLVKTLLPTTDLVMDSGDKRRLAARFTNPDPCQITEALVFTDPFLDPAKRNEVLPENYAFVHQHIYSDQKLRRAAALVKDSFMNHSQALLHGGLHTGSFFVKEGGVKVLDPEFACYGPIGYDLGNVLAHLAMAWCHALILLPDEDAKLDYMDWMDATIADTVNQFKRKFKKTALSKGCDPLRMDGVFMDEYIEDILHCAAGVAGCEIIRRVIGNAKVRETLSIENLEQRKRMERILLLCGANYLLMAERFKKGMDFVGVLRRWSSEDLS